MATTPDPATKVQFSTRLWSEEVARAEASDELEKREVVYEWSNGRKFYQPDPVPVP